MDYRMVKSNDTLEGMHPTLRQVPPREPRSSIHSCLETNLSGFNGGNVPSRPSSEHHNVIHKAPRHLPKPLKEEEAGIKTLWIKANWNFHHPCYCCHGWMNGSHTVTIRVHEQVQTGYSC